MIMKSRTRRSGHLVGTRIRKLRKERNLTQAELAARVGVQQSDLCRMETGEYKVSLETLFKILSVFEMNIAEFFHEQALARPRTVEGEILDLLGRLGERERKEIRDFLLFKVNQRETRPDHRKATGPEDGGPEGLELEPSKRAGPD